MAFSCVFYDILFPDGEPLGLIIERHRLTYTVHGRTQTIDCCAVVSSFTSSEVAEGDILININEFPLLNNPALLNAGRDHFEIISKMINEARPPRRIRFLRREAMDGEVVLSDTTVVSLRPDEASLIYDEVQQKEHEERLRVREREKLAAIEREKQRVEEEERRHAEAVERKRREDLELKIIRERQRLEYEEQERRFYEDHPATANLYEIAFPVDQRSFGLTVTARRLTYVKESRKRRTIDCCAVTHSELTAQVKPGDIIIKVNDLPLVSDRTAPTTTEAEQQAYFTSVMQRLQDAPVPRTLMLLRPVLSATFPGTDLATPGLSDQLLLYLSRSEEATIFETPTDRTDRLAREAGGLRSRSESNASVPVPLAGMMMSPSTPPRRALPSANLPTFDSLLGSSLIGPGAGAGAGLRGVLHSSLSPMSTGTYMTEEEEIAKRAEERILQLKRQMGLLPAAPPAATPSSSYGGAAGSLGGLSEEEEIQRRVEDEVRRRFEAELKVIDADHLLRPAAGGGPSASASTRAGESAEEEIQRVADAMVKKRVEEEMRRVQDDRARQMEEEVRRRVSEEAKRLEAQQRRELEHKMREIEEYKKAVVEGRLQELEQQKAREYAESMRKLEQQVKSQDLERQMAFERERRRAEDEAGWLQKQQTLQKAFDSANTRSPATGRVFKIMFPNPGSTGLRLIPHAVLYTDMKGRASAVDCAMVMESKMTQQVQPGDVLVSVNNIPLTANKPNAMDGLTPGFFEQIVATINGAEVPRSLVYYRPADGGARAGAMATSLVLADALLLFSAGLPDASS